MTLTLADRVRDTTATIGTGTITLSGTAPTGYQTFETGVGNGNTTYYTINSGNNWEVGIGTYSSTGPTLTRDTVLASSASGAKVDFPAGTKDVFVTYPAERSVYQDGSSIKAGTATLGVANGGTGATTLTSGYLVKGNGTSAVSGSVVYDNGTNVGIGTSSPGYKLTVSGGGDVAQFTNGTRSAYIALDSSGFNMFTGAGQTGNGIYASAASNYTALYTASSERMRIDNSGNLLLKGPFLLDDTGLGYVSAQGYASSALMLNGRGDIRFTTGGTPTGGSERMRIDSSGNVGIGTSSPGAKLDVVNSGVSQIQIKNTSGTTRNTQLMFADNSAVRWRIGMDIATNNNTNIFQLYNDTTTSAALSVDTSGNLGLGVTPNVGYGREFSISGDTASGVAGLGVRNIAANNNWVYLQNNAENTGAFTDAYWTSAPASKYAQNQGNHYWYNAPSGTAGNAISFTQAMTLDASGNLGVGVTSPFADTGYTSIDVRGSTGGQINFGSGANRFAQIVSDTTNGLTLNTISTRPLRFFTNGTEAARIDSSGNLLVGTTALAPDSGFSFLSSGYTAECRMRVGHTTGTASGSAYAEFLYAAGTIGSITQNGTTAVAYNTSSDYRLKDIDGPVQNSGAYIDALKPVQGSWKVDGSRFIGLIAHEVQEVSETQIATGVKDGEEMQAMDYSAPELIANLIAEIQSLRARVAQLEGN